MTQRHSVLICDDQELVRKGLRIILQYSEDFSVVGEAVNGIDAVHFALQYQPDLVLMDLKMPVMNGVQAVRQICQQWGQARVVVLTTFDSDEWVFSALQAGAMGYLLKSASSEQILLALRDTLQGKAHLDPQIAVKVLRVFQTLPVFSPAPESADDGLQRLSEREQQVLQWMAQGKTNAEIAAGLYLAPGTVKNIVSRILEKLQVNDRTQAVLKALQRGRA
jgi:DNA-binding NarL/FixJ family response regulator